MMIWGRPFKLDVFTYDEDGYLTANQKEILDELVENPKLISQTLDSVIAYLQSLQQKNKEENHDTGYEDEAITKENLFEFVKPECISVPDEDDRILLMCKTPLDPEEGLAIRFDSLPYNLNFNEDHAVEIASQSAFL